MKTGYKKSSTKSLKAGYLGDSVPDMAPTISLGSDDLPAIKDWKVGSKYKILLEVEQTGMHKHDTIDNDSDLHATFKVISAKAQS